MFLVAKQWLRARRSGFAALTCALWFSSTAFAAEAMRVAQVQELSRLSLEELVKVEVTSVSKAPQQLSSAPAAIYVITAEEIERSGVRSIPEALRLAPNLQVEQLTSSGYSITARGFGDNRAAQTQANKLLILVDGRSVYSPLFSGVLYDAIDVMMDDIDRIEVISGPGATLWGANAMNGVINIITRRATQTEGSLVRLDVGAAEQAANARFGGRLGEDVAYRVYGKVFDRDSSELEDGTSARDRWNKRQAGVRIDWQGAGNALTLQGDLYRGTQSLLTGPAISQSGMNVLGRWQHTTAHSQFSIQTYYDRTEREAPPDGAPFSLDTYDIEIQQALTLGAAHQLVWGAGRRLNNYYFSSGNRGLQFRPNHRSLGLGNFFLQDTATLGPTFKVTAGVKLEDNPYSRWSVLPDLRLSWEPSSATLLWAAASKAIRAPTPFDVDVAEFLGTTLFLRGNPAFKNESVWAYEIGYRGQPANQLSLSVSAFYDVYRNLRTVEPSSSVLPLLWDNRMKGHTYGIEAWANVQITSWWRLSPGFRSLQKRLHFQDGASGLVGLRIAGDDPTSQIVLKSAMSLGQRVTLDGFVRHVGELPDPFLPDYYEFSARLAWRVSNTLEVAISGFDLLHPRHAEYPLPDGRQIERSVFAQVKLRL